jgi:deazaflavin-dependent oxidoreductase (nitroreductase family)
MPTSPLFIRLATTTHLFWYRLSGGRIGGRLGGAPILLLTTTGRKSGRSRTRPLPYTEENGAYVVIGSNGGNKNHPAWYLNLVNNPTAEIEVQGDRKRVRFELATGEDRARLWAKAVERYRGYDGYQRETKREIPVVVLRPV